jgi:hypothetical protein
VAFVKELCLKDLQRRCASISAHTLEDSMPRLGDDIDDYCSRCKRTMDHSVVTMSGDKVQKTRCRTCGNEHSYRKNKGGKSEMTAQEAFAKVLSSVTGQMQDASKKKKSAK